MADHRTMKLGKKSPKYDIRTLKLAKYLPATLPPPPASCDWSHGQTSWGMMLNDNLGDCTIAACGHAIQVWTQVINQEITVGDDVILSYYEKWDGYNPSDPSTDQGGVELDVLNNWRQNGLAGHQLAGFAQVDPTKIDNVKQAIALFGGVYIGISLPQTAQTQDVWTVTGDPTNQSGPAFPGSWGGHAVFCMNYDANGIQCITWGAPKWMNWAFWSAYVDESYALLSNDFINQQGLSPSNFNLAALQTDLSIITS